MPTEAFAARLRCRRPSGCRRRGGRIRVKRVALVLDDHVRPTLALHGSLFAAGSRRGVQSVAPWATDIGGGVRFLLVQVDGQPVTAQTISCHVTNQIAIRLRPCPGRASASFAAATASLPFRQGPNVVRVCAADYATTTAANRTCTHRRVRIDNLCPVSEVAAGATLGARLRRDGNRAIVAGRVLDGGGRRLSGVAPLTDAEGRFRARIPSGPSREVRVAYWPSTAGALERYLHLDIPARPHLRLSPGHPVHNGDRVRFRTRLPGPAQAWRRVRIQVRVGGRWLELRHGRTGKQGTYRARYRFHATTGRRTYGFRAVVPKQRGYPYEAGRSHVERVTVIG
ncbi:MAG: hypothetical protein E6G48_05280 [Actinobacteria bacterium]|nr:MAG: hypothetical protein E6G48_05280 [Actinomycetota bacterium]